MNPANEPWKTDEESWLHPAPGIEYANHTYSMSGATSLSSGRRAHKMCEVIARCYPIAPGPASFPSASREESVDGGTPEEVERALAKHHLINRPLFKDTPSTSRAGWRKSWRWWIRHSRVEAWSICLSRRRW